MRQEMGFSTVDYVENYFMQIKREKCMMGEYD